MDGPPTMYCGFGHQCFVTVKYIPEAVVEILLLSIEVLSFITFQ